MAAALSRRAMARLLSSLMIALGLLLAPLGMANGAAAAMPHHGAAMTMAAAEGPCAGMPAPADKERKADLKLSCASACAAFIPAVAPLAAHAGLAPDPAAPLLPRRLAGLDPERETPPPRTAPEI
jgi:hypothetical protein